MNYNSRKALVACFPDPSGNPRPNRAIKVLVEMGYEVHGLCAPLKSNLPELGKVFEIRNFINGFKKSTLQKLFFLLYKFCNNLIFVPYLNKKISPLAYGIHPHIVSLRAENYDLLLAEDLGMLPILFQIQKSGAKLVFDAREYYPAEFENSTFFRLILSREKRAMCKYYIPKVDIFYTVSFGLANLYENFIGIRPQVIRSLPYQKRNIPFSKIGTNFRMVHHGLANPDRQLEQMIEVMSLLDDRFSLDFYLCGSFAYIQKLKKLASSNPRIKFKEPVEFDRLNEMLVSYDIGFYFLNPSGLNTLYSLPNKFFEFIQANLVVAIGPSPEMLQVVNEYDIGVIAKDFTVESMASALNSLRKDSFDKLRHNITIASSELTWESELVKLKYLLT